MTAAPGLVAGPAEGERVPARILPAITLAQLLSTSLWFAVNGALPDMQRGLGLDAGAVGWLTSAVQLGFIAGTLCFALLMIADRFSMRWVYLCCALLGALANAAVLWLPMSLPLPLDATAAATAHAPLAPAPAVAIASFDPAHTHLLLAACRFATGFFLAGIYPVGMKIASSWFARGLGAALGFLVGALVVGTGLPHLLRALATNWPWQQVIATTSLLALAGGLLIVLAVPDGPNRARAGTIDPRVLAVIVRDPRVRASAFGYFGHMWELYAMLALTPLILAAYLHSEVSRAVSLLSFVVIAGGGVGCVLGGQAARRHGSAAVAAAMLACSGLCALLAPWMSGVPWWLFVGWLLLWGVTVSGDSPQFSALTAANAPREAVGSVLTLVNCIGFSITIVSVQLLAALTAADRQPWRWLPLLAIGPALGLLAMRPLLRRR